MPLCSICSGEQSSSPWEDLWGLASGRDRLETVTSLLNVGKGAEQSLCIRMERAFKYVLQGSVLNDLTGIYYGYLIAYLCDDPPGRG